MSRSHLSKLINKIKLKKLIVALLTGSSNFLGDFIGS